MERAFSERERKIFAELRELAHRFEVSGLVLFGSRARRTQQEKSDIDLAVSGCRDFAGFAFACEEEVSTLLQFDVIDLDKAVSPELQEEIRRDGVVLYEKCRKTPGLSYGDIRHVHRICVSN